VPGEHSGNMSGGAAGSEYGQRKPPVNKPRNRPGGKKAGPGPIKGGQRQAPERPRQPNRPRPPQQKRGPGGPGGSSSYLTSNGSGGLGLTNDAPAAVPGINDFLSGDDTYQSQLAALTKALANYKSQMGERTGEYNTDFARKLSDLNLTEQRNTTDQADDYAGRGMFISGLYGKARGDLERDFDNREGDMNLAKNQFLSGLNRDFTNFQEENNLSRERAKQDSLNRRSLQYML
jgi:hypothetical protein